MKSICYAVLLSPIDFRSITKSRAYHRENKIIFCTVLSGDNKNADIMQQQPRLVARRRVDFCLSLNTTRALSESQVKVESPRHRRPTS